MDKKFQYSYTVSSFGADAAVMYGVPRAYAPIINRLYCAPTYLAGVRFYGVAYYDDDGASWSELASATILSGSATKGVSYIVVSIDGSKLLVGTAARTVKSTDGGLTWTVVGVLPVATNNTYVYAPVNGYTGWYAPDLSKILLFFVNSTNTPTVYSLVCLDNLTTKTVGVSFLVGSCKISSDGSVFVTNDATTLYYTLDVKSTTTTNIQLSPIIQKYFGSNATTANTTTTLFQVRYIGGVYYAIIHMIYNGAVRCARVALTAGATTTSVFGLESQMSSSDLYDIGTYENTINHIKSLMVTTTYMSDDGSAIGVDMLNTMWYSPDLFPVNGYPEIRLSDTLSSGNLQAPAVLTTPYSQNIYVQQLDITKQHYANTNLTNNVNDVKHMVAKIEPRAVEIPQLLQMVATELPTSTAIMRYPKNDVDLRVGVSANCRYMYIINLRNGDMIRSTDSGATFNKVTSNLSSLGITVPQVTIRGSNDFFVSNDGATILLSVELTGYTMSAQAIISRNSGTSFAIPTVTGMTTIPATRIAGGSSGRVLMIVASSTLLCSVDRGATWSKYTPTASELLPFSGGTALCGISINESSGIITGCNGGQYIATIQITSIGSPTLVITTLSASPVISAYTAISRNGTHIAIIRLGIMYISHDGGVSWPIVVSMCDTLLGQKSYDTSGEVLLGGCFADGGEYIVWYIGNSTYGGKPVYIDLTGDIHTVRYVPTRDPENGSSGSSSVRVFVDTDARTLKVIHAMADSSLRVLSVIIRPYIVYTMRDRSGKYHTQLGSTTVQHPDEDTAFANANIWSAINFNGLTDDYTLCRYTNQAVTTTKTYTVNFLAKDSIILAKGDILFGDTSVVETIRSMRFSGSGKVKIAFSLDGGVSWNTYNNGFIVPISALTETVMQSSCADIATYNTIPVDGSFFDEIFKAGKIRFAYLMYRDIITDVSEIVNLIITYKIFGDWMLADGTMMIQKIKQSNMTVTFLMDGSYKINYIK